MMKTCLVVDDSKVIRKVARHILEVLEYHVDEAADGEQALTYCLNKIPEVILLDWNMPVMSGIDFVRALRKLPDGDTPRVIFCTTENGRNHIEAAINAGANEYVMKPFDRETLESKLQLAGAA